jgi:hypothetical protein
VQAPAFISFVGVDDLQLLGGLQALSSRYPLEWGIVVDAPGSGNQIGASRELQSSLLQVKELRWSAHVCGNEATRILHDPDGVDIALAGVGRIQLNHSRFGSSDQEASAAARFGRRLGASIVLQCQGTFPAFGCVDWLFDTSFGAGLAPASWPALPRTPRPFCGYAGGIGPSNVAEVVRKIDAMPGQRYWIDMESGVRTGGRMDLDKCESVCRAIFGGGRSNGQ